MKRIVLFLVTNLAVMLVLSIAASVLGVNRYLTANGLEPRARCWSSPASWVSAAPSFRWPCRR
jgi:hypothetical protein